MDIAGCVSRLAALVGVPERARNEYDWPAIESSIGLRLPDDYKRLVETFPDGIFRGLVHVNRPGDHHESPKEFLGYYAWRLHDLREWRDLGHRVPYPIFPEPGGLLPWATGPRAELFFWLTEETDSDAWPVVTASHDFTDWRQLPGTACELLIDVVEGRFDGSRSGVDPAAREPKFQPMDDGPPATGPATRSAFTSSGETINEFPWLAARIGPPPLTPPAVDWGETEQFMGVPLPSDYRSFIDTYGPGTFGDITIAVPGGPAGFDLYQLLRRAIEAARAPGATRTVPICPEPDGIIAWGETADGWTFSWAPLFPDADRWSVVAYNRDFLVHIGDTSFSQFLRKYAEGSPDVADFLGVDRARVAALEFTPAPPGR